MSGLVKVIIHGSRGRMGQALLRCAAEDSGLRVVGEVDHGDVLEEFIGDCDVVIDFTLPDPSLDATRLCRRHRKALVMGTTGHSELERSAITECADEIPIVFAPNFSVGVNALFWLTRQAARILGEGFDLEVVEMHHRLKKDSPSGTARRLGEILAEAKGVAYEEAVRHGREGIVGERTALEIGMHAIRGGDVVGDHTVIYASPGERVELTHRASSRDTFAKGALRAAKWVAGRGPGLFSMEDVLGLSA